MISDHAFTRLSTNKAGLVNNDNDALFAYKKQRENSRKMEDSNRRIDALEKELAHIKTIISSIAGNRI